MSDRLRWRDVPAFLTRHIYAQGQSPRENHPAKWGPLEVHRYGRLYGRDGMPWVTVGVHSTRRSRDGWTYNVAELQARPQWVGYFHHGATGRRILHRGTDGAQVLERAFGLLHLL